MPPLCRAPRGAAPLLTAERAAPPCRGLEFRALIASTQNTYWTAPCPQTENNNSSSQTTEHLLVLQGAHTTLSPKVGRALGPKRRDTHRHSSALSYHCRPHTSSDQLAIHIFKTPLLHRASLAARLSVGQGRPYSLFPSLSPLAELWSLYPSPIRDGEQRAALWAP